MHLKILLGKIFRYHIHYHRKLIGYEHKINGCLYISSKVENSYCILYDMSFIDVSKVRSLNSELSYQTPGVIKFHIDSLPVLYDYNGVCVGNQ